MLNALSNERIIDKGSEDNELLFPKPEVMENKPTAILLKLNQPSQ